MCWFLPASCRWLGRWCYQSLVLGNDGLGAERRLTLLPDADCAHLSHGTLQNTARQTPSAVTPLTQVINHRRRPHRRSLRPKKSGGVFSTLTEPSENRKRSSAASIIPFSLGCSESLRRRKWTPAESERRRIVCCRCEIRGFTFWFIRPSPAAPQVASTLNTQLNYLRLRVVKWSCLR